MEATKAAPRYGINSYLEWVENEGLRVAEGLSLNLFEAETGDWPRFGAKAAVCHFTGSGDYNNMFVIELPAGGSTLPQTSVRGDLLRARRPRFDAARVRRRAQTQLRVGAAQLLRDPARRKYRHFNGSGTSRALLCEDDDASDDHEHLP